MSAPPDPRPVRGELVELADCETVRVVAVDREDDVWTVVNVETRELALLHFDENRNYRRLAPSPEADNG